MRPPFYPSPHHTSLETSYPRPWPGYDEARLVRLEEAHHWQSQHNEHIHHRLGAIERSLRRGEDLARLKAAQRRARKDLIRTGYWLVSTAAWVAYATYLFITGQHEALLRVLGLGG